MTTPVLWSPGLEAWQQEVCIHNQLPPDVAAQRIVFGCHLPRARAHGPSPEPVIDLCREEEALDADKRSHLGRSCC